MRILLDECVHAGIREAFRGHAVKTVAEAGWRSSTDGPLLALAQVQFDVFITIDRSVEHQQNLADYDLGFVVVRVSNEIAYCEPLFERLRAAAETVRPGEVILVVIRSQNASGVHNGIKWYQALHA